MDSSKFDLDEKEKYVKRATYQIDFLGSSGGSSLDNSFSDIFLQARILDPRENFNFYSSFVNYFITGIEYDRLEDADEQTKNYLAKEIKDNRDSLVTELIRYVSTAYDDQ